MTVQTNSGQNIGKTVEIIEIWRIKTKTNEATHWANRLETAVSVPQFQ